MSTDDSVGDDFVHVENDPEYESRMHNRQLTYDSLATALSVIYAKLFVILGIAFPVTEIISHKAPPAFYTGFYIYLYAVSVIFVVFMFAAHLRTRAIIQMIDSYGLFCLRCFE